MAFRHSMAVRFADVDHAGIVYFARFFDYCHATLEAFLREHIGARAYADLLDRDRMGFPAVHTTCRFVGPLRFGDIMNVELAIERMGRSSITFAFRVFRQLDGNHSEGADARGDPGALCAEGTYIVAVIDLDAFKSIAIPDSLRATFAPLLAS